MKKPLTSRDLLYFVGALHLLGLYAYGMLVRPVLTAALALAWIILTLSLWRETP